MSSAIQTILLTGASGFVGRHVAVGLIAAGYKVYATSRDPVRARNRFPWLEFVRCDLVSEAEVRAAMQPCNAAVYLYHGLGSGPDYPQREAQIALTFRRAAEAQKLERIVYLGGVEPQGVPSKHLSSRLNTGALLRKGSVPTLELRASMIIGNQGLSFSLIRDIVTRTPLLALPRWLDHKSCPIAVCDVAVALTLALTVPLETSTWFDLPGPECLSHRSLLASMSAAVGTHLLATPMPYFSPNVAAFCLSILSRVPSSISRELVKGLTTELVPSGVSFWSLVGYPELRSLRQAIADAFTDGLFETTPSPETRARIVEKTRTLLGRAGVVRG
jgi:uncharacterized protein YbjT (DUF2867 family)